MKLYKAGPSPFVRKVLVTLHVTGLLQDVEVVTVKSSPLVCDPALKTVNPACKIPVLEVENGLVLHDSRVICRYLDNRANAGLYPENDWDALTLEATADALLDSAVLMVYEDRFRPEDKRYANWIEGQWRKVSNTLDALNFVWIRRLTESESIANIAVGCALGYLDFRHSHREWRKGRSELSAWFEQQSCSPVMRATDPAIIR